MNSVNRIGVNRTSTTSANSSNSAARRTAILSTETRVGGCLIAGPPVSDRGVLDRDSRGTTTCPRRDPDHLLRVAVGIQEFLRGAVASKAAKIRKGMRNLDRHGVRAGRGASADGLDRTMPRWTKSHMIRFAVAQSSPWLVR